MSGTFGDREAHIGEDRGELVDHLADRMDAPGLRRALAHRQRDVDAFGVEALRRARHSSAHRVRAAIAAVTRSFRPLIAGPLVLRSSGVIAPSVFSSAETEPFLPSAATRTASSAASSPAAAIAVQDFAVAAASMSDMRSTADGHVLAVTPGTRSSARMTRARDARSQAGKAALAFSTIAWNAAGSRIARSDSTLRSTVTPALSRPSMKRL